MSPKSTVLLPQWLMIKLLETKAVTVNGLHVRNRYTYKFLLAMK